MHAADAEAPTVFMLDGMWPEFDHWISTHHGPHDRLFLPLDGQRRAKPQYAWSTAGFAEVRTHPLLTLWRAWAARRIAGQGAARQRLAIRFRQRLAAAYVRHLRPHERTLVITQELLPYVWESGALRGRRYSVLMTSLPMQAVQEQLDRAHQRHPYSRTLGDFRAAPALLASEQQALAGAACILTPHTAVAALFAQSVLLPWRMPAGRAVVGGQRIVFPAVTVGRKGAYELRAALRELGLPLTVRGAVVEAPDFWDGLDVRVLPESSPAWLDEAAAVVLPSWLENRPGALLQALAAGIPVVATPACGLPPQPGLRLVPPGEVAALRAALSALREAA
ncbi:glycosyltransferase family 4 protein [Massilia sp. TS11]|uniref:glycosyltransferase n=1 Tax=Massilia sp. TS11 TaxID=2908003 RepID=UPI001EDC82E3|nr:glycosyltransferase family 4 protein [Massilia sp. TS11]MCG2583053.1 glycosyltransferase family 4 protein [Massilia sp. TS11]